MSGQTKAPATKWKTEKENKIRNALNLSIISYNIFVIHQNIIFFSITIFNNILLKVICNIQINKIPLLTTS